MPTGYYYVIDEALYQEFKRQYGDFGYFYDGSYYVPQGCGYDAFFDELDIDAGWVAKSTQWWH